MLDLTILLFFNFWLVLGSILAFMLPFYLAWWWPRRRAEPFMPSSGNLELFFSSRATNALVFVWAFAEAVIWFVIPEFLLLLLIFMRIERKLELLLYDIAGTVVGVVIAYSLHLPAAWLEKVPYIAPNMIVQTRQWYDQLGMFGLVHQPFSGVPFKVFNTVAAEYHYFLPAFLIVAVIVRISRYYLGYAIFKAAFPALHPFVARHYYWLFAAATLIFSILLWRVYSSFT